MVVAVEYAAELVHAARVFGGVPGRVAGKQPK